MLWVSDWQREQLVRDPWRGDEDANNWNVKFRDLINGWIVQAAARQFPRKERGDARPS